MNFCGRCGAQAPDGAMNCPNCGAPLQAAAPQQQPPAYGPQGGVPGYAPARKPAGALGAAFLENFKLDSKLILILISHLLALVCYSLNFAGHFKFGDSDYAVKYPVKVIMSEAKGDLDGATATLVFIVIFLVLYAISWVFMTLPLFGSKKFTVFNFCPLAVVSLGQFILQIVAMAKIGSEGGDYIHVTFCGVLYFILLFVQIALLGFLSYKTWREMAGPRAPRMQYPQQPQYPQYPQQPQPPQYPQQPMM